VRDHLASSQYGATPKRRGRKPGFFWRMTLVVGVVGGLGAGAAALPAPVPATSSLPTEGAAAVDQEKEKAQESRLKAAEEALARQAAELSSLRAELASDRSGRQESGQDVLRQVDEKLAAQPPTLKLARPGYGLTGFLQVDSPFRQSSEDQLNGSTGDLLNQNRIYLRRARLRFYLDRAYGAGALELDANTVNGTTARAVGAEASLKLPGPADGPPLLMLTGGLFKTPFGFEIAQSDRDRLFMERSTAEQALFPGEYDGGVRLSGGWRFVRYALAAMNGEPLGERSYPGRDPNKWKDLVGRLGLDTAPVGPLSVWAGVSALSGHGFHRGATATKDVVQWRDLNDNRSIEPTELTVLPGSPPTPSFSFTRNAVGGDLGVRVSWPLLGETAVYGEVYLAQNLDRGVLPYDPSAPDAAKARELGWYVALTQQLGPWAMVGARYDFYDPDRDASETRVGRVFTRSRDFKTLALAAAFTTPYGRLVVEYDRNRNHLGRDLQGRPTNLKDDAVIVRGQVNF
jgi:hypothetical protein